MHLTLFYKRPCTARSAFLGKQFLGTGPSCACGNTSVCGQYRRFVAACDAFLVAGPLRVALMS